MFKMKFCVVLLYLILCVTPFVMTQILGNVNVIPYPNDCTKYQQCDASGCFIMTCGIGTEFNPAINTCDYPLRDRTGCSNRKDGNLRQQQYQQLHEKPL